MPLLFEWYKHIGILAIQFACISQQSPSLKPISPVHYAFLIGSLGRCARLMLSTMRLGSEAKHGETTALLARCLFETCIKISWLCKTSGADRFERLIAEGLKTDLELKQQILAEIGKRGGVELVIERRMIGSIDRFVTLSGMDEATILSAKQPPNLASMMASIAYDRLDYVCAQRMGSHYVHGTFSDLVKNYLDEREGALLIADNLVSPNENEYIFGATFVLRALKDFVD